MTKLRVATLALCASILLPGSALAQQPAASASAAAAAPAAAPTGGGELPPGHPPAAPSLPPPSSEELPPDHPKLDALDPASDAASPHQRTGRDVKLFQAPGDTIVDDDAVPVGTISARILDAHGAPLAGARVKLHLVKSTIAQGETADETFEGTTDPSGRTSFTGLKIGSSFRYDLSTVRDGASYAIPAFFLSDKAGKSIVLHAYRATKDLGQALVGMQGGIYIGLKEDTLSIEEGFNIFNVGEIAWLLDNVTVPLPEGARAFNTQEMDSSVTPAQVGDAVALNGTVPPGRTDLGYRYSVPLSNEGTQTIRVRLPPNVAQFRVIAEASASMALNVEGFPPTQPTKTPAGQRILITERQVSHMVGGLREIEITLTGLPTAGPGRWIALGLAAVVLLGGVAYAMRRSDKRDLGDDLRRELRDARESLLDELIALDRAHAQGEVGPKSYARIQSELLDALARIVAMLESEKRPAKSAAKAADTREPA